jgi:hypothetical protein
MLVPPLLVTHAPATGRRSAALVASASSKMLRPPLARRVTSRGASLIADQIHCGRQPNEAGRLTACRRLRGIAAGSRRVASPRYRLRPFRECRSREPVRDISPDFVRDDPGLAGLSEGGCHGHDDNCGGCEHVEEGFAFEHGVTLHACTKCYVL